MFGRFRATETWRKRRKLSSIMSERVTSENSRKDTPRSDLARNLVDGGMPASRVRADYQAYASTAATLSSSSQRR